MMKKTMAAVTARLASRLTEPYGEANQQREERRRELFKARLPALFQVFEGLQRCLSKDGGCHDRLPAQSDEWPMRS